MPAIAADAEGRRPAKEQGVCPSTCEGRGMNELMGFARELRENAPVARVIATRRRVNVLVDARKIVLQNWRLSQRPCATTPCAFQNRSVAVCRILAASSVENRHGSLG